jgi:preprotein translocase subunit SecA
VQVIDLPTGRRAPDRAFEGAVHALIEAQAGPDLSPQRETAARISYQSFFRRYLRLGGMTGTVCEVAREIWNVYRLRTVSVPTRLPSRRTSLGLRILETDEDRWGVVAARVRELHETGRPVLLGTASVGASEELSERLSSAGLAHQVLNALQDREEASVIARAGEAGRITVATRMAGRGTDIKMGPGVLETGGLAVISTEIGEARRIDRQLFGRCGRQGEPGSYEQIVSLEDRVLRNGVPNWLRHAWTRAPFRAWTGGLLTHRAQRAEQRRGALARQRLLKLERSLEQLLAFTGGR